MRHESYKDSSNLNWWGNWWSGNWPQFNEKERLSMNTQERTKRIAELNIELAGLLREQAEAAAATDFDGLSEKCKEMCKEGNRVEAVKLYRNKTGCGLREAMYAVDALLSVGLECFYKKCGGAMKPGNAIAQTWTGLPDFPNDKHCVTFSPGGSGKLIDCVKCEKCGWSMTSNV